MFGNTKNLSLKASSCFVIAICAALVVLILFVSTPSRAHSCDARYRVGLTVKNKFLMSDVVFNGVVKNVNKDKYYFDVKKVYKPSNGSVLKNSVLEVRGNGEASDKLIGKSLIVYAHNKNGRVVMSPCIAASFPPDDVIAAVANPTLAAQNPYVRTPQSFPLIFTGKVTDITHHLEEGKKSNATALISKIGFANVKVLHNTTAITTINEMSRITLEAQGCGEKYSVGHEYIVFGQSHRKKVHNDDGSYSYVDDIEAECMGYGPYDLHEADILKELTGE